MKATLEAYRLIYKVDTSVTNASEIAVSWDAVSDATYYKLYSSTQSKTGYEQIYAGSSTSYNNTALSADTEYYYRVSACTVESNDDSCSLQYGKNTATTASSKLWQVAVTVNGDGVQLALSSVVQIPEQPVVDTVQPSAEQDAGDNSARASAVPLNLVDVVDVALSSCLQSNALHWLQLSQDGSLSDYNNSYRWGTLVYGDWDELITYANSQQLCGFDDWRVPSAQELLELRNSVDSFSQLQQQIPYLQPQLYWTNQSTGVHYALAVDMFSAELQSVLQYSYQLVIIVR